MNNNYTKNTDIKIMIFLNKNYEKSFYRCVKRIQKKLKREIKGV